ncbi:hypothetical protein PM082_000202 [Marasmius tenuissimus]|nr:hypothetical protein PM082_000202 [Marasmius tenuissimus]
MALSSEASISLPSSRIPRSSASASDGHSEPIHDRPYRHVIPNASQRLNHPPASSMHSVSSRHSNQRPAPVPTISCDMKKLLSKPALVPGMSGVNEARKAPSTKSVPPKRAASYDNYSYPERPKSYGRGDRSVSDRELHTTGRIPLSQSNRHPEVSASPPKPSRVDPITPVFPRMVVSDDEMDNARREKERKSRSFLRPKTSSSTKRPTSPSSPSCQHSSIFKSELVPSPLPYNTSFFPSLPRDPQASSSPSSHSLLPPKPRSRLKSSSPSPSHDSSRTSSRSRCGTFSNDDKTNITPAEEVMLAYKRQREKEQSIERRFREVERKAEEARRLSDERHAAVKALRDKELERGREQMRMMQGAELTTPPRKVVSEPEPEVDEVTPPSTPYYTVFGSVAGHDNVSGEKEEDPIQSRHRSSSVTVGIPKSSDNRNSGFRKSLGRKFSFRWRHSSKQDNLIASMPNLDREGGLRGGKELLSPTSPTMSKGIRLSLDKQLAPSRIPNHQTGGFGTEGRTLQRQSAPIVTQSPPPATPSPGGSASGNTFRNVFRRLSTNGLRDRSKSRSQDFSNGVHSAEVTPAPPVPALPKGVVSMMKSGSTFKPTATKSASQTRSAPTVSPTTRRPRTSPGVPYAAPLNSSWSSTTTRPSISTATRSSSPDRLFGPSRSIRSSISSYGSEIPPLPSIARLDYPISPPNGFPPNDAAQKQQSGNVNKPRDLRINPSHRRPSTQTDGTEFRSESPTIPEFSNAAAINTFPKKSPSGSRRPSTSTGTPTSSTSPAFPLSAHHNARRPSTSHSLKSSPISALPKFPKAFSDDGHGSFLSTTPHSLPTGRKSGSFIARHSKSSFVSTIRGNPAPSTATEERWESLLQKSEQAGGTLHIHGAATDKLESDTLRFSAADDELMIS